MKLDLTPFQHWLLVKGLEQITRPENFATLQSEIDKVFKGFPPGVLKQNFAELTEQLTQGTKK